MFNDMICFAQLQQVQAQDNVQSLWPKLFMHSWVSSSVYFVKSSQQITCPEQARAIISSLLKPSHYEPSISSFAVMCGLFLIYCSCFSFQAWADGECVRVHDQLVQLSTFLRKPSPS
jgi:hypothetical protein